MYLSKALLDLFKQVIFSLIAKRFLDSLPLVNCDDDRSSFFDNFAYEGEVIHNERGKGVHHIDHNVTLLHMHHGANLHFAQVLFVSLI